MCRQMVNKEKKGQWQQGKDQVNKIIRMTNLQIEGQLVNAEILAFCGSSFLFLFGHFVATLSLFTAEGKVRADA